MKRLLATVLTLICLLPLSACDVYGHTSGARGRMPEAPVQSAQLLDMQVIDLDQGNTLPRYPYAGRNYLEGQPNHRFSVALQNLTGERVLAVLSVDGVNAITGQTASASQGGYVLEPWQRVEIKGWRSGYADVNEFFFTTFANSYATRTGRPQNLGVIGVAAFRERRPEPIAYEAPMPVPMPMIGEMEKSSAAASGRMERKDQAQAAGAPSAMPQQIGTGYGERRYDPVTRTEFERESSRPNQIVSLYYDSYDALVARGILPSRDYRPQPDPFPVGFVPAPPQQW